VERGSVLVGRRSGAWDERLSVDADGNGLVGHAGAVLLRKCADATGLTAALGRALPQGSGPGWWDRGEVMVSVAVSVALGGTSMSDIALLDHQASVFGDPPSDSTVHRTLGAADDTTLGQVAKAMAVVRERVWRLVDARPGGFPWLSVAGKALTGWVVIDLDATLITAHSEKTGAAATFKKGFGFHPLAAWCANTRECLAMLLRPGNAGSNTVADHIKVLDAAIAQIPDSHRKKILVRVDGAGATHELLDYIRSLNTAGRTVRYTVGWTITKADEDAVAALPDTAWGDSLHQDATANDKAHVAELTGLSTRTGWPSDQRLIVRRTHPSRRQMSKLTAFERSTGWRYAITATDVGRMPGVGGSHQPQWLDALHRSHATVEDRVRTDKAMGLRNLPSKDWTVNQGWVLAANIANDLDAWTRMLGLYDQPDLAHAEPDTLRYRLWHLPARLTHHARRRWLHISRSWPWRDAFLACWQRLCALPPLPPQPAPA
jgi:DDE family transposase